MIGSPLEITVLGSGTSQGVPVIACECEVCKSENPKDKRLRSAIYVKSAATSFVIDTGPDFRQQILREGIKDLNAVIFTHEHKDHIAGLDDVRAFNFKLDRPMDVYATERVQAAIKREFHYIFSGDDYPGIPKLELKEIAASAFRIGEISVLPIEVKHYKLPVLGFRIGDFTYITDAKSISEKEKQKVRGSKVIILNALRRHEHISHFTLDEAVALMKEFNPKKGYFTHISHYLGKHDEVNRELPRNLELAYDGLKIML